jgi:hypothetical protein
MEDKEINDCIDKKNNELFERVETVLDRYTISITTLITTENQSLRHSINELTKKVEQQNGTVRDLKEWKDFNKGKTEGAKEYADDHQKRKLTTWQVVGIIAAVIVGLTTASMGVINTINNKQRKAKVERIENWMDLWDFSPVTRGGQPILDTTKFEIKAKP